jgi:hypothetical protein
MGRRVFLSAVAPHRTNSPHGMKESNVWKTIMLAAGKAGNVRLFRNNTGQAWQGTKKQFINEGGRRKLILTDPRPIDAGLCEGSSDLIGWVEVTITPEMVGQTVAVFTAIEAKQSTTSEVSEKQLNFLTVIKKMGGIAGLATSPAEALRLLRAKG